MEIRAREATPGAALGGSRLEPAVVRAHLAQVDHLVGILIGAGALAGAVVLHAEHALAINALDVVADQLVRRPQLAAVFARPAAAVCALKPPTGPPGPEGLFVHKVSRTSKFDPRVFLLGQTILNAEDSFGIVSVNGWVEG